MGVVWGGPSAEDNIPGERVVCHPPARPRCGTKTWNMNFWPLVDIEKDDDDDWCLCDQSNGCRGTNKFPKK